MIQKADLDGPGHLARLPGVPRPVGSDAPMPRRVDKTGLGSQQFDSNLPQAAAKALLDCRASYCFVHPRARIHQQFPLQLCRRDARLKQPGHVNDFNQRVRLLPDGPG